MGCNRDTAKPHSSNTNPTDIFTYRYKGKLVYVPVGSNYDEAIKHARDAFPQLKGLCDDSLSLSLLAPTQGHTPNCIGISAPAWPKLIVHMARYQIVDVHVSAPRTQACEAVPSIPDITITDADAEGAQSVDSDPAPPYRGSDDRNVEDEKTACSPHTRPRTLSESTMHHKGSWFQRITGQ